MRIFKKFSHARFCDNTWHDTTYNARISPVLLQCTASNAHKPRKVILSIPASNSNPLMQTPCQRIWNYSRYSNRGEFYNIPSLPLLSTGNVNNSNICFFRGIDWERGFSMVFLDHRKRDGNDGKRVQCMVRKPQNGWKAGVVENFFQRARSAPFLWKK